MTSFGLIKDGWLYDSVEGPKVSLEMWDNSSLDTQVLVFYAQILERQLRGLDRRLRDLELKVHGMEER